jgi:hypothetical protein
MLTPLVKMALYKHKSLIFRMSRSNEDWNCFTRCLGESIKAIKKCYFQVEVNEQEPMWRERVYCYELYHQLRCRMEKLKFSNYTLHGEIDKNCNHGICMAFSEERYNLDKPNDLEELLKNYLDLKEKSTTDGHKLKVVEVREDVKSIKLDCLDGDKSVTLELDLKKYNKFKVHIQDKLLLTLCVRESCPNPDFVVHHPGGTSNLLIMEAKTCKSSKESAVKDIKKIERFLALGDLNSGLDSYEHGIFLVIGPLNNNIHLKKYLEEYKCEHKLKGKISILCHERCEELPRVIFGEICFNTNHLQ